MSDNVNKLTGRPYNGETAKDVDFGTFVQELALEEIELRAIRADKYGYGEVCVPAPAGEGRSWRLRENSPVFEVYTSAWWEHLDTPGDHSSYVFSELSVKVNSSVVVKNRDGERMARIEARYDIQYYIWLPMDDETFVKFSETRVMDDMWPQMKQLVNDMLVRFELDDFLMPERATAGPIKREVNF